MIDPAIQTITILVLVISTVTCWGLCWTIASYLCQKSQNYQTLVDRFVLDFLFHFVVFKTIMDVTICLFRFQYQCGETFALLFQAISALSILSLLTWLIAVILVKYTTIFHPSLFADSDDTDKEILLKARFFHYGIIIIQFILEFGYLQNFQHSFIYLKLSGKKDAKQQRFHPGILHLLILATISSIIYVNLKIKRSGYQDKRSKKWLQKLIPVIICFVLIYTFFPVHSTRPEILKSAVACIFSWTVALLPALFIATYDNLRNYLSQKFHLVVWYLK